MVLRAGLGFDCSSFWSSDTCYFLATWPIVMVCQEVLTVKHAHIICYLLEFPSTFIKLCHACEELELNAKCSRFGVHFIDVKNTHECCMKFDNIRISLTRERYWYDIRDVLVPIIYAL